LAVPLGATYPVTYADIAGAGAAAAPISATAASAIAIQFAVSGAGTVRIGDANTSATRGIPIAAGGADYWGAIPGAPRYELDRTYYYIPVGATLSITVWR
ncbi:MAG TPA: hypothetical protein VE958_08060, partial [Bryobacteraceae bacterium]|nr:hypothetical protein [Bryobacteraceae bacterium]